MELARHGVALPLVLDAQAQQPVLDRRDGVGTPVRPRVRRRQADAQMLARQGSRAQARQRVAQPEAVHLGAFAHAPDHLRIARPLRRRRRQRMRGIGRWRRQRRAGRFRQRDGVADMHPARAQHARIDAAIDMALAARQQRGQVQVGARAGRIDRGRLAALDGPQDLKLDLGADTHAPSDPGEFAPGRQAVQVQVAAKAQRVQLLAGLARQRAHGLLVDE